MDYRVRMEIEIYAYRFQLQMENVDAIESTENFVIAAEWKSISFHCCIDSRCFVRVYVFIMLNYVRFSIKMFLQWKYPEKHESAMWWLNGGQVATKWRSSGKQRKSPCHRYKRPPHGSHMTTNLMAIAIAMSMAAIWPLFGGHQHLVFLGICSN